MNRQFSYDSAQDCADYIREQFRTGNCPGEISDAYLFHVLHQAELYHLDKYGVSIFYDMPPDWNREDRTQYDCLSKSRETAMEIAIQRLGDVP